MELSNSILNLEREALDHWSAGDPEGYSKHAADDITYFDDIGAQNRIESLDALRNYASGLKEMIPPHKYEMVGSKVQLFGDTAILTYHYHPFTFEGNPLTKWRASVVYNNSSGEWKMVHANWTMEKGAEK